MINIFVLKVTPPLAVTPPLPPKKQIMLSLIAFFDELPNEVEQQQSQHKASSRSSLHSLLH